MNDRTWQSRALYPRLCFVGSADNILDERRST